MDTVIDRGQGGRAGLPAGLVYAGCSLGVPARAGPWRGPGRCAAGRPARSGRGPPDRRSSATARPRRACSAQVPTA